MEKTEYGCPVAWRTFGYVCQTCGAADFGGRDLCQGSGERWRRLREKALADAQAELAAARSASSLAAPAPVCARVDLAAGPDRTVEIAVTRWGDAAPRWPAYDAATGLPAPASAEQALELPAEAPRVTGLCGLAGSGKSTAAEFLEGLGYVRLAFADPLKAMLRALLASAGVPQEDAERMLAGDLKEAEVIALECRSPRYAMQTLGTEWGRKLVGADLWVRIAARRAKAILDAGGRVVFEDVRMANEAEAVRQLGGGQVWQLKGRAAAIAADGAFHPSERLEVAPDLVLDNSGDLEQLEAQILEQLLG